jgi:omega-hydroxy-beta-dihydromenaquinone-9 sulfotransferase
MNSVLSRMGHVYRVLRRTFGIRVIPIFVAIGLGVIRIIVGVGMALDHVFFPRLRKTRANRPIVLVGNPRTGTTFLQRFLADEGLGAGMELFMMLYPSLLIQKLLRPFVPLLEKISPAKFHATKVHDTNLSSVETDDVAVLFRYLDGFFFYGFFLAFDEQDHVLQFDPRVRDPSQRDFAWLDKLWRRSLVLHKSERNVAKLFSLSTRLPQFLKRFPEAQVLYLARDPLEIIPSTMSLVTTVLDRAFHFWKLPDDIRKRWLDRVYKGLMMLLERFHEEWASGAIDKSRVFLVRYDRMMADFEGLMDEMCKFLGHEMTPKLRESIRKQGEKQRKHESGHKYDLAKYGLTEEQVRRDFAFFYDAFLPPMEFPTPAADKP